MHAIVIVGMCNRCLGLFIVTGRTGVVSFAADPGIQGGGAVGNACSQARSQSLVELVRLALLQILEYKVACWGAIDGTVYGMRNHASFSPGLLKVFDR